MLHKEVLKAYQNYEVENQFTDEPRNLYEPINYILSLGGKKVRPVLTLLGYSVFKDDYQKAMPIAFALEVFHNFTLLHDDVMDHAETRRGKDTVHVKWDIATAILSGDEMLIRTCDMLYDIEQSSGKNFMKEYLKMATEVCQGQQSDMDFEDAQSVDIEDYVEMIRKKTAVLLATAAKFGARLSGAGDTDQNTIYQYAERVGIGFQMMDDYLDTFGDESFGKRIGGDILEDKKTWLYLKALELANAGQKSVMQNWHGETDKEEEKIEAIRSIYTDLEVEQMLIAQINEEFSKADEILQNLQEGVNTSALAQYVNVLGRRTV